MYNQSLLGVKKRLGHAQIGLLKRSDQHPRRIHMVAVKGPKFNRKPSKKLFFTVNRPAVLELNGRPLVQNE